MAIPLISLQNIPAIFQMSLFFLGLQKSFGGLGQNPMKSFSAWPEKKISCEIVIKLHQLLAELQSFTNFTKAPVSQRFIENLAFGSLDE